MSFYEPIKYIVNGKTMTRERPPGTPGYFGRRGTPFNSSYVTSPPINQTHWRVAGRDDEWFYLTQTRFPFIIFCPQTIRFLIIYWATLLSLYHRVFRAKVFVIYLTIARNLVSTCAPPARPVPTTIQTVDGNLGPPSFAYRRAALSLVKPLPGCDRPS